MATVTPYLIFNGQCEAAFNLYKKAFGGEFLTFSKFSDMPNDGTTPPLSDADANRVMHVCLPIGETTVLMGSDSNTQSGDVQFGNNISISINAKSKDEADTLYTNLSEEGQITMPLQDTFWGAYFGMFIDKLGVNWMINYDYPQS
ncbi:VOC family protein [Flavobacterium sp.]|uniref:VOC family protein n=1 Tax=Flavobacterium sp. TaxID=239 RepID=UPI003D09A024